MTQTLLHSSSQCAIDFACSMIDDGLWTAGRSRASGKRFQRACDIVTIATPLSHGEHWMRTLAGKSNAALEEVLSDFANELSDLAREAIADKSLRTLHFDPWVLTHVIQNDADARAENALPLAA